MLVPQYWAEARLQVREPGRQITIRRFGWSDESVEAAEAVAKQRAEEAMRRARSGEKLDRREVKVPYNGADGVPIREEVLARHGEEVITRNSYGAPCLNTPDVMFLDLDFREGAGCRAITRFFQVLLLGAAVWAAYERSWKILAAGLGLALFLAPLLASLLRKLQILLGGGIEKLTMKKVEAFLRKRPEWSMRVYRTPAGLRLLAQHRVFRPDEEEVGEAFKLLEVDETYAMMCLNQKCFRARLGPKPWRIGIGEHMRPRVAVWPLAPEKLPLREKWVRHYTATAAGYAACRYVADLGQGLVDARVERVRHLHDELARAHSGLPIA